MTDTVVIEGEVSLVNRVEGEVELINQVDGDPNVLIVEGGGQSYPHYQGDYTVAPSLTEQILETDGMVMDNDVTVEAVPQGSATTPATIITADPTISVSSGGLITAQVNKTQQITPTVQEGYVEEGTPGNVGVSGSNTQQLTTQGAQTIHPASTDQTIASGKYLTGAQTFKAVTVSGLTADKVLQGNVIKIGDADDDDSIMSVTGTAQGGITPTGTKQINIASNGTVTEDVTNYASAEITTNVPASAVDTGTKSISSNGTHDVTGYASANVQVPNSYSVSDEGKVVSNGALVAQTSDTVTENDTYDTTLINSLTVNVSGGGGIDVNAMADRTLLTGDIVLDTATAVNTNAFEYSKITSVESDTVKSISNYGFSHCEKLKSVDFPNLNGTISAYTFQYCYDLESVNLPKANAMSGYTFRYCSKLTEVMLPGLVTSGNSATGAEAFRGCTSLQKVDLGKCVRIDGRCFDGDSVLDTLILRRTSVCALADMNAFGGTPFASGGAGGTIYVPSALLSTYPTSTNWSTLDGYGTVTWKAIEGSIYEL